MNIAVALPCQKGRFIMKSDKAVVWQSLRKCEKKKRHPLYVIESMAGIWVSFSGFQIPY